MKPVEKIGQILQTSDFSKAFEMHHQFKMLKIEITKLQTELKKSQNDKAIMEHHLSSTIQDLSESNKKIRSLRRRELAETEKEIKFQESKLKQITDSMTSSMAYIDRDFTYRYLNNKYTEWFGVKSEEIVGKTVEQVAGSEFFNAAKPLYEKVFAGHTLTKEIDTKIANTDTRLVSIATYVPAYNMEGKNIGAYLYGTDITKNKEQTELIRKSKEELRKTNGNLKKYIESNVQLEQFAFVAAHDMKAPLRSITSFSKILLRKLEDRLNPKEKEYFEFIETGANRLTTLIGDLLDYSKVGNKELELQVVDMNVLLSNITKYLATTIDESNAQIVINPLPNKIRIDRVKMSQVFQNLISNSIKFTADGITPRVEVSCKTISNKHVFTIQDNGIGMADEYLSVIFESFKQLNRKEEYEGTGLGLSICKKIVEHHGGSIKVDSIVGEGSCFTFEIPKN